MTSRTEYNTQTPNKPSLFDVQYLRNHRTLDIGVLGYIGIVWPKEHSPEVRSFPPGTPCIYIYIYITILWKTSIGENRKGKAETKMLVHTNKLQEMSSICLEGLPMKTRNEHDRQFTYDITFWCFLVICIPGSLLPFHRNLCHTQNWVLFLLLLN